MRSMINHTTQAWLDKHNVTVINGKAYLYKAVDSAFMSKKSATKLRAYDPAAFMTKPYKVGAVLTAPDWNSAAHCGNGLHLSPTPAAAASYFFDSKKYVEVEVDANSIVVLGDVYTYHPKCKVRTLKVIREVTKDFDPVAERQTLAKVQKIKARRFAEPVLGDLMKNRKNERHFKVVAINDEMVALQKVNSVEDKFRFIRRENLKKSFALAW